MEVKLTIKELSRIAQIAGNIAGIADGMEVPIFPTNSKKKKLYDLSNELMDLVREKIKKWEPDNTKKQ